MAARKSSSGSSRSAGRKRPAAKKSACKRSARKSAAKKSNRRRKSSAKKHGLLFKLCFWPFLLLNRLTDKWHPLVKWPARAGGSVGLVVLFCMMLVAMYYYGRALTYDLDKVAEMPARTLVYARDGKSELGRLHGDNRYIVRFDQVSQNFRKALIAREDARFYQHGAVDIRGIGRVMMRFFQRGKKEGASTITMQLARNTFPLGGRTLDRKLLEIAVAFRIERKYKKDEILQHYMNRIFWGHSIRGIEAASR
ncbi:MAG: transglycosylase domain-containing protein, partial [Verrucomicrobiae bacterium]|nr:transglycosylase domain-containing protein [Verrucomicrobiae bacterium]NNJ87598.1 transglycosylase domain-containing protein [Akkermansiaceae bacterium]